jgi:hypothetical protein
MATKDEFKFPDEIEESATKNEDESGEIEIEIVDDTPEKDRGRKPLDREVEDPSDDEMDTYSDGVKKRIKELTHARHDERRAKEALAREKQELERIAQHIMEENKRLKQHVSHGEQTYSETIKAATHAELENAKRKYKEAYEAGDSDALLEAQEALTDAKMRVEAAKNFKPTPLQQEESEVQLRSSPPPRPEIDDKTLRWQAKNQWFGQPGYEELTSFSLGLHQKLVNSGVDPRSDDYFERIDARMKSTFPEVFGKEEKPKSVDGSKKPATVVASATRSSGARKVEMSPTQVALAKKFGLTPQQYAVEVARLEKQNG